MRSHLEAFALCQGLAPLRRQIVGMPIDGDDLRIKRVMLAEEVDAGPVVAKGAGIFEVADMLGNDGSPFLKQTEGRVQLTAQASTCCAASKALDRWIGTGT